MRRSQSRDTPAPGSTAGVEPIYSPALNNPLDSAPVSTPGTSPYRTLHLQRLANPLQPWNPPQASRGISPSKPAVNPYLTIDTMPIDIASFNGVTAEGTGNGMFASRQRGYNTAPVGANNLWLRESLGSFVVQATGNGDTSQKFPLRLQHSLGYMTTKATTSWSPWAPGASQISYTGMPDPGMNQTFPWLSWNSRPYISQQELLLVPRNRSSRLTLEFQPGPLGTPFNATSNAAAGHLPNFFASDSNAAAAPQFYRILDYLGVPSPFVGTDTVFSPAAFYNGALPSTLMTSSFGLTEQQLASNFHPPFTHVSNYREPGKVNINTLGSLHGGGSVPWTAILNGAQDPAWAAIVASRRGTGGNVTDQNSSSSSVFAHSFRAASGTAFRLPGTIGPLDPEIFVTMSGHTPHSIQVRCLLIPH